MSSTASLWATFWSGVLPSIIGLVVAVCAVGTLAVYNWGRTRGLVRQVEAQGKGGKTTVVAVQAAPAAAGGAPALAAPVWNQLDDPLPDGAPDPFAQTDCGEESVAMVVAACGGPPLPAGTYRMLLGGASRPGPTTARALAYLLALFTIKAHPRQCDADTAWVEWQHSFSAGYLVIALGYWVSPQFLHWVVVRETTSAGLLFNDPWGGEVRTLAKPDAQKLYAGWYVHVDQATSAPAPAPPGA